MALLTAVALSAALAGPLAPFAPSSTTPEQTVAPATSVVTTLRAPDPRAGQPAWTVRLSRSVTGLQCSTVGQVQGETFGIKGLDGAFRALPEANADACTEPGTLLGARVFAAARTRDVRTVISGVAGAGVERVTVRVAGGRPRVVAHTADGAYVAVVSGYPEDAQPAVTITRAGASHTETFSAKDGLVVADPFGGRAWRLQSTAIGSVNRNAKLRVGCMGFRTARAVPGEPSVSSPQVCGLEANRAGVKHMALYFATRRLSGAGSAFFSPEGAWNHHAPRVAVWGTARGAKRIVVRAGGRTSVTRPRLNGGFLVFLPLATPVAAVRVEVDGKRYGSTFGTVSSTTASPARASATASASASGVPVSPVAPGRLADGRYAPGWVQYRVTSEKPAVTLEDPAGGIPWAIRSFDADRVTVEKPTRSLAKAHRIGRSRCVQLGRLRGATFGWIYGDGEFRKAGTEYPLLQCTSLKRPAPVAGMASILNVADPAAAAITSSAVWGLIPGADAVTVAGSGAADGAAKVSADGAFLRLGGPGATRDAASVSGAGHTVRLGARSLPSSITDHLHFPALVPGTQTIEAPAPDPAGGPSWAMRAAQTTDGVPCAAGPTQVVGGLTGDVDLRMALLSQGAFSGQSCRPLESKPTAERPCDIGWGFGNAEELEGQDAFLAQARSQRRLLAGRSTIAAVCSADVERVTLRTPHDVRTLVPSAVGRAVLAVYDGEFVDGELVFTAHLRGGGVKVQRQLLSF